MIRNRWFCSVALAAVATLLLLPGAACGEKPVRAKKRPNILFIFADQFRADVCGVYGGKIITTPSLDRLAREGIAFDHALSTCPLCTPFRGMLMTGKYPTHSGIIANFFEASPRQNPHCLATVFSAAGYDTGLIGKWHLAASRLKYVDKHKAGGPGQLKDRACEFVPPGARRLGFQYWAAYNFHAAFNNFWYFGDTPQAVTTTKFETEAETDLAIDYMTKHRDSEKPFFLVVAPHPPHPPFAPKDCPAGYLEKVPKQIPRLPNVPADNLRHTMELRCYYAMAKNTDDCIGRLLTFLDKSGLSRNTIVVFTADHGEMHGSHGLLNKMVPYAEAVNLPLIMRWPGTLSAGKRMAVLQTPMDHFPTLCGLAGIRLERDVAGGLDGIDLSPVLLGTSGVDRQDVLMANYTSHWDALQTGTNWPEWRAVHTLRHTYVKWLSGKEELYDNVSDRYQMTNLVDQETSRQVLDRLRGRLKELLVRASDDFRPGAGYGDWFDNERNLVRTGLGPVK